VFYVFLIVGLYNLGRAIHSGYRWQG